MRKLITFNYRCQLQARWVIYLAKKLKIDELEVATKYGKLFANKLNKKYEVQK